MTSSPWLLYAYPWMPYPRRVIIYLREKGISSSLVQVVHISDPGQGNHVVDHLKDKYPPRPAGSLPILAIPFYESSNSEPGVAPHSYIYIRQSIAIMNYLEELCDAGSSGFPLSRYPMRGSDLLERARITEVLDLAKECTVAWNPVRTFGSAAGSMTIPAAAKEMLRWVRRPLATIERWWEEQDRDMSLVRQTDEHPGQVTMADIVLFRFLELTKDCYAVDMTKGSGKIVKDAYGRDVVEAYPKLVEFCEAFMSRQSARRIEVDGEVASKETLKRMRTWAEGSP